MITATGTVRRGPDRVSDQGQEGSDPVGAEPVKPTSQSPKPSSPLAVFKETYNAERGKEPSTRGKWSRSASAASSCLGSSPALATPVRRAELLEAPRLLPSRARRRPPQRRAKGGSRPNVAKDESTPRVASTESVTVDAITWSFVSAHTAKALGSEYLNQKADGTYLVVNLRGQSSKGESATLTSDVVKLKSASGATYTPTTDVIFATTAINRSSSVRSSLTRRSADRSSSTCRTRS